MTDKKIIAFKGFDNDFTCRGFQYAAGETYTHEGKIEPCESGFHSCANPWDVLNYYDITNRFAIVIPDGEMKTHEQDSKIASAKLTIEAELKLPDFISKCINYINDICNQSTKNNESGDYAQIGSSGDYAKIGSSGDSTQIGSSGDYAKIEAKGAYSIISCAGIKSKVKGGENCALSLSRWVESEERYRITVAYVGENGIKQDTWYTLDDDGNFVECE